MKLEILTAPSSEPVTLAEAKRYARLHTDLTDDDSLVESLIRSARQLLEGRVARCFVTTTLRETRVVPEDGRVRLLRAPIQEILSVEIDGTPLDPPLQGISHGEATLEIGNPGKTVVVEYKAGYGDADDAPETAKIAILLLVVHWFDNRSPVTDRAANELPLSVQALADSLRWGGEVPPR